MAEFFPIIDLTPIEPGMQEQQGTKEKYWFDDQKYLLKIGRENTGENWSEKVASELATLLGLPHAHYELALWRNKKGVVTENFVPQDGRLVMGNELLSEIYNSYPTNQIRKVSDHSLGRIRAYLINPEILLPLNWLSPTPLINKAIDVFLGYLLFDAWIANQDRHHENWGIINHQSNIHLAPSYDHAASLGQNETDHKRKIRLSTRDPNQHIRCYIERARTPIYPDKSATKPLSTLDAYRMLANKSPQAAKFWQQQLNDISFEQCRNIFDRMPLSELTETAIEFALTLLELNKKRLLA